MSERLASQCEFTCQGCGMKAPGEFYDHSWHKPFSWFERSDSHGPQTACSRRCIKLVAEKTGKSDLVLPL
jgi:hypothetical protein